MMKMGMMMLSLLMLSPSPNNLLILCMSTMVRTHELHASLQAPTNTSTPEVLKTTFSTITGMKNVLTMQTSPVPFQGEVSKHMRAEAEADSVSISFRLLCKSYPFYLYHMSEDKAR